MKKTIRNRLTQADYAKVLIHMTEHKSQFEGLQRLEVARAIKKALNINISKSGVNRVADQVGVKLYELPKNKPLTPPSAPIDMLTIEDRLSEIEDNINILARFISKNKAVFQNKVPTKLFFLGSNVSLD